MAFNASGEVFNGRKHGNALIIGAMSGLGFAIANIAIDAFTDMSDALFAVTVFAAFFMAFGIDRFRSSGGDMVANNATEKKTLKEPQA
jgi:hypothetical protein